MIFYILFFISTFGSLFALKEPSNVTCFNGSTLEILGGPHEEISQFRNFPLEKYKIYEVPNLGSFYIDNTQDIIKGWLSQGKVWESHIVNLIKYFAQEGTVVVDIGSHIGTHLLSMSQAVGKNGYVIGFEPHKKIFSELIMNMKLNKCKNIKAYRCAIGKEFSRVQMNVLCSTNEGGTGIGEGGDYAPLIPLDSLQLSNVSFIKIDVEGYEDEVLAGAKETIFKNRPFIIIELWDVSPQHVEKRNATIKNLENMGYTVKKIWGWDWLAIPKK